MNLDTCLVNYVVECFGEKNISTYINFQCFCFQPFQFKPVFSQNFVENMIFF